MIDPNMYRLAHVQTHERLMEAVAAGERAQTWERAPGLLNWLMVRLSRQFTRFRQVVWLHDSTPRPQEKRGHVW